MKRLMWLGVFFVSSCWLFFLSLFNHPNYLVGSIFLVLGVICNIFGLWQKESFEINKKYVVFLIPLLLAIIVLPLPYSIGMIILTSTFIAYFAFKYIIKFEKISKIFPGLLISGILLIIQTAMLPFYSIFVVHTHRVDFLTPIISWFGGLFGLKTAVSNGILLIQTYQQTYPFTTTVEKLGFFTWFNIFVGLCLLLFLLKDKRKILLYMVGFFVISFFYLILRYIGFLYLYVTTSELDIFWNTVLVLLSFLPLALICMKLFSFEKISFSLSWFKNFHFSKTQIIACILVFLCVFSYSSTFLFQDPGVKKNGKILIDEFHSDWEDTQTPLDTNWYGVLSTYNYYSWAEWLKNYYTVDINNDSFLTSDLLEKYDMVILKCPTSPYVNEEVIAIERFVESGGGLYLIGDHTNVFGMNTYLNQVAEKFGLSFKTDATYELGSGNPTSFTPEYVFAHPIVQHMDKFEFLTSCTLEAPLTAENVIVGSRILAEPGTYSTENFFRESVSSPDSSFGMLLQVAAFKYGKGRVVAFTDSTCFSNFCVFTDGYQSFNLGVIEFLNRENLYVSLNVILVALALILFLIAAYLLRGEEKTKLVLLFIVIGVLAVSLALPLFSYVNELNYPIPQQKSDFTQVCFEQEYSNIEIELLPSLFFVEEGNRFGTFYVWTQRVGCIPTLTQKLQSALHNSDIAVIINPDKSFDSPDINSIIEYVNSGGRLLVMDSIFNENSTVNELISIFNMKISTTIKDAPVENLTENITKSYLSISGGEPLIFSGGNETAAALVQTENNGLIGKVVVLVDSFNFSDAEYGGPFTEPDDRQKMFYNYQFFIFTEVLLQD